MQKAFKNKSNHKGRLETNINQHLTCLGGCAQMDQ